MFKHYHQPLAALGENFYLYKANLVQVKLVYTCYTVFAKQRKQNRVLCTTPTVMLSSTYNSIITDAGFSSDTIHSTFRYPVDASERPQINWGLLTYDLIVINELYVVPSTVFDHILTTLQELHVRPIVLLCGDQQQQQLIATIEGRAKPTTGVLQIKALLLLLF